MCLWWMSGPARAAEPAAVVDAILIPDARGGWKEAPGSVDATFTRAGATASIVPGALLEAGDIVRTSMAQVRLRVVGDEVVVVGEQSEVELGPRTWLQRLGSVIYRVHGVFRVKYASVEAAVDGTRFVVGPDRVDVLAGSVRVTGPGWDELVRAGQGVALVDGAPVGEPGELVSPDLDRALQRRLGPPRFAVVLEAGGGLFGDGGAFTGSIGGRFQVARRLELFARAGVTTDGARVHIPFDAGLAARFGWFRVGVGPQFRLGQRCTETCEESVRLFTGGLVLAGATVPLGGRVNLELTIRGGFSVEPNVDGSFGLSFGL